MGSGFFFTSSQQSKYDLMPDLYVFTEILLTADSRRSFLTRLTRLLNLTKVWDFTACGHWYSVKENTKDDGLLVGENLMLTIAEA